MYSPVYINISGPAYSPTWSWWYFYFMLNRILFYNAVTLRQRSTMNLIELFCWSIPHVIINLILNWKSVYAESLITDPLWWSWFIHSDPTGRAPNMHVRTRKLISCSIRACDAQAHQPLLLTWIHSSLFLAWPLTWTSCCVQISLSLGQSWSEIGSLSPQQSLRRQARQTKIRLSDTVRKWGAKVCVLKAYTGTQG